MVRYPRADVAPLDLIAGEGRKLAWLGPLNIVWTTQATTPEPVETIAPDFNFQRTGEFSASIGLRILQALIKNIGGISKGSVLISSTLSFTYEAPRQHSIAPLTVGKYLARGDLDLNNAIVRRYVDAENVFESKLYVISEVLKARKLLVRVSASNQKSAAVDVEALQQLADGSASIISKDSMRSEIAFDGAVDLTFAFRAYEIGYVNGTWNVLGVTDNQNLSGGHQVSGPAHFQGTPMVELRTNSEG